MEVEPIVVKEASCPSLSHQSQLEYQIGSTPDGIIHIRITGNSGNGYFNGYWIPLPKILSVLNDQDRPFIWSALCPLFEGRSVNSACFLMAVLLAEKIVVPSKVKPRRYECANPEEFMAKVQALMAPKPKKGGVAKKSSEEAAPEVPAQAIA